MIIFTTPKITEFVRPKRISSTVKYFSGEYILAEVSTDFDMTEEEVRTNGVYFWWEVAPGYINPETWDITEKYNGGAVEAVYEEYDLSKEQNVALAIYQVSEHHGISPFELWEKVKY